MKKLATTIGLFTLMLIVTSFTTPNEIGGKKDPNTSMLTFESGGKKDPNTSMLTFETGGKKDPNTSM